jgi:MFS family permease
MTFKSESGVDTPAEASGFQSLFHNRQFMSLWIAQIFSQFSDRAVFVLFVAVLTAHQMDKVAGHSFGAAQMTSYLYVAFTIPAVVLSPIAGVYCDRWSNRATMFFSNIARGFFVMLVALSYFKSHPIATFSLAFFLSIGSQFFGPAET